MHSWHGRGKLPFLWSHGFLQVVVLEVNADVLENELPRSSELSDQVQVRRNDQFRGKLFFSV